MRKRSKTEPAADSDDAAIPRRRGDTALARAVALLSRREHSALELRGKLIQRGFEESDVDAALSRLTELGLQDDARFAETLGRVRANSGHGPQRLRAELSQHGLSAEQVNEAIAAAGDADDWLERALDLARRRWPQGVRELRDRRRLADFLIRRGFAADHVRAVVRALSREGSDDEGIGAA